MEILYGGVDLTTKEGLSSFGHYYTTMHTNLYSPELYAFDNDMQEGLRGSIERAGKALTDGLAKVDADIAAGMLETLVAPASSAPVADLAGSIALQSLISKPERSNLTRNVATHIGGMALRRPDVFSLNGGTTRKAFVEILRTPGHSLVHVPILLEAFRAGKAALDSESRRQVQS